MSLLHQFERLTNAVDIAQRNAVGVAEKARILDVRMEVESMAMEIGVDRPKWTEYPRNRFQGDT